MSVTKKGEARLSDLRKKAEQAAQASEKAASEMSPEEIRELVHELHTHQIELEIQNEELRRAELLAEESRDQFLDLYEFAPNGYMTLSGKGLIIRANLTAADMLETDRSVLEKSPFTQFIADEDQDIHYRCSRQILDTGQPQSCELRMKKAAGTRLWVRMEYVIPAKEAKEGREIRLSLTDITECKKTEEALHDSEKSHRNLTENIKVGIYSTDGAGHFVNVNRAMTDILGFSEKELNIMNAWDLAVPEIREKTAKIFYEKIKTSDSSCVEVECLCKDGKTKSVEISIGAIKKDGGIYGVVQDITERKLAEDALRRSEEKFRSLVENAPNIIMVVDRDGIVQFINHVVPGLNKEDVIGKNHFAFIAPEYHDAVKQTIDSVFQTSESSRYEIAGIGPHGKQSWYETQVGAIRENNQVIGVMLVIADITERKQAESREQLARDVLKLLNQTGDTTKTIRNILGLVKKHTGFEAVGIRLREGDDFPYYCTNGFPDHFVEMERYLCARDKAGEILRDPDGDPVLECMCGNVIRGRADAKYPFFTENGSFWSNCTTKLLATTTEKERQAHTRNRCNGEGYESVALIPLQSGDKIIGLLQLNDHRCDQFTLEMIRFFEGLGTSIGIALDREQAKADVQAVARFPAENPFPVMRVNKEGVVLYANEACVPLFALWKCRPEMPVPESIQKIVTEVFDTNVKRTVETRIEEKTYLFTMVPILKSGYINIYGLDITDRNWTEDALRRSEEKSRSYIENAPDGVFVLDNTGRYIEVNKSACRITGYSREEIEHMSIPDLLAEESLEDALAHFMKLMETGAAVSDLWHKHKNGSKRCFSINAVKLSQSRMLGFANDITERKRTEEELKYTHEAQAVISSILKFSLEKVTLDELCSRLLEMLVKVSWFKVESRGCIFLAGSDCKELVMNARLNISEPICASGRNVKFGQCMCGLAAQQQKVQFTDCLDDRHTTRCEDMREHGHYCVPVVYAGKTLGVINLYVRQGHQWNVREENFLKTVADVLAGIIIHRQAEGDKDKMQSQLMQSQKMEAIGTLAGGVAHDFNNLLTVIKGNTELGLLKLEPSEPLYSDMTNVKDAADRAAALTRQLLLYSRRQPMDFVLLNANSTVKSLLKMLKRLIGEDIMIRTELEKEVWTIKADAGNIEQVIMNIAVNARDAMPEGGALTIKTENQNITVNYKKKYPYASPGQYVCISIQDTGCGMDEETRKHMFEPFYTTKDVGKGTGLGMSVVYGIVREHKGWINLYSEPGQGTIFRIYLPAVLEPWQEESRREKTAIIDLNGQGERILIVEDEDSVLETARRILEAAGYEAVCVLSAEEAIDIFKKEEGRFDLLFTDTILPGKSGLQLIEELRVHNSDLRVLLGSGYTGEKVQREILMKKKYPFIQKPYDMNELLMKVRKLITRKPE